MHTIIAFAYKFITKMAEEKFKATLCAYHSLHSLAAAAAFNNAEGKNMKTPQTIIILITAFISDQSQKQIFDSTI
jgi:1,4-dihydroxy-2-naphthoyl-CoA synthase